MVEAEVPRTVILKYLGLRTYSLGTYNLAQPILDLATHSLRWLGVEVPRTLILMYLGLGT